MSGFNSGPPGTTWVALDVHKDSITSAVLGPADQAAVLDRWFHDEPSIRRFAKGLGDPGAVRLCYEAGPTGYPLARPLKRLGIATDVIAPSRIPVAPGPKIKTDARDARRLVHLYRAGELTPIHVPTEAEEAIRDLVRTRGDMVIDRSRARHRLNTFLLRHGEVFRAGKHWTIAHDRWVAQRHFEDPALDCTLEHYRCILAGLDAYMAAVESDLKCYLLDGPFAEPVARLCAYRGVTEIGALTLASEVCDWRRFPRATSLMGFCGLVPSEYSSGESKSRGHITKAGNTHLRVQLIESAWSYQHKPYVGAVIQKRHQRCDPDTITRAWRAQVHLCAKFRRLAERKRSRNIVVTAIARELSGFLWAEMVA